MLFDAHNHCLVALCGVLYPSPYTFDAGSVAIFRDAVRLGRISCSKALDSVDFDPCLDLPLQ